MATFATEDEKQGGYVPQTMYLHFPFRSEAQERYGYSRSQGSMGKQDNLHLLCSA